MKKKNLIFVGLTTFALSLPVESNAAILPVLIKEPSTCKEILASNRVIYPETRECCVNINDFNFCTAMYGFIVEKDQDLDGDGISDRDEIALGHNYKDPLDPIKVGGADDDNDGDGLNNKEEILFATNIEEVDSDLDGLSDFEEIMNLGTSALNNDSDGDDLNDWDEVNVFNTNPLAVDTDGDGLDDRDEVLLHLSDPNSPDSDGDKIGDKQEVLLNMSPINIDTDGGGLNDFEELIIHGTDPLSPEDDRRGVMKQLIFLQLHQEIPGDIIPGNTIKEDETEVTLEPFL